MQRVRQGLLPVTHPRGPQDPPHGGVSAQVPRVQSLLQPAFQPENPPADPCGTPGGVYALRPVLRQLHGPEESRAEALQAEGRGGGGADHVHVSGPDDDEEGGEEDARVFDRGHHEALEGGCRVFVFAKDSWNYLLFVFR